MFQARDPHFHTLVQMWTIPTHWMGQYLQSIPMAKVFLWPRGCLKRNHQRGAFSLLCRQCICTAPYLGWVLELQLTLLKREDWPPWDGSDPTGPVWQHVCNEHYLPEFLIYKEQSHINFWFRLHDSLGQWVISMEPLCHDVTIHKTEIVCSSELPVLSYHLSYISVSPRGEVMKLMSLHLERICSSQNIQISLKLWY